jgi:hypothetical protein
VPDRVFLNWRAHYAAEPWGGEQELLAKIISQLSILIAMKTGKNEDYIPTQGSLPIEWVHRVEKTRADSQDAKSQLAAIFKGDA